MASRKVTYALAARSAITALAEAAERIAELDAMFKASGYDSTGADSITDEDLVSHDVTTLDLANVSTFAANLAKFLNNEVPMQFDYATAINKFRAMS